uniref:ATP synthase F0 subunit 8 n=1 Tax=Kentrochrysalis sieversi TaxID=1087485 RepID=UPI0027A2CD20|nr:ATP synthase F0 subunit 8 [Kentrochrysalis sieversi]WGO76531.1 ATP synthase F0 subunit 8 [Kentrochrysalis sieversi]
MPQMMPINWIMSLFIFICIFIMFNIMNYYIYSPKFYFNKNKMMHMKNNFIWKW